MIDSPSRFPLAWPIDWPRASFRQSSPFGERSMERSIEDLCREVRLLGGSRLVLSTNVILRQDGWPYSGRASPADPGAAVYFERRKKPIAFACDKWTKVEHNVYAIAKHIEAMRGQGRWGVGTLDRAFTSYAALPAPVAMMDPRNWWLVLGVPADASLEVVRDAWLRKITEAHPDHGGSVENAAIINAAWEFAQQSLKP